MPHLTQDQLQQLYDKNLDDKQTEAMWQHLDSCEPCLDRLTQWYEEQNVSQAMGQETVAADGFQHKLMQRINREEAVRAILNFGYTGLMAVFNFIITIVFSIGSKKPPSVT